MQKPIQGRNDFSMADDVHFTATTRSGMRIRTDISWLVCGGIRCGGETAACEGTARRRSCPLWLCRPVSVSALGLPSAAASRCCPDGLGLDPEKLKEQNYVHTTPPPDDCQFTLVYFKCIKPYLYDCCRFMVNTSRGETHSWWTSSLKVNCCSDTPCGFPSLLGKW